MIGKNPVKQNSYNTSSDKASRQIHLTFVNNIYLTFSHRYFLSVTLNSDLKEKNPDLFNEILFKSSAPFSNRATVRYLSFSSILQIPKGNIATNTGTACQLEKLSLDPDQLEKLSLDPDQLEKLHPNIFSLLIYPRITIVIGPKIKVIW